MAVLRRLTAVVTLLATLLLVLAESGFACSAAEMPGTHAVAASNAMPGMDRMTDMPMAGAPAGAKHDRAPGQTPAQAPCRLPWAPGGCRDMAPCAPAALTVAAASPVDRPPAPEAMIVAHVTAPTSIETPPEPPPPRA